MRAAGTPLITPTTALALLAGICTCLSLPQVPPLVMAVLSVAAGIVLVWRWSSRRWIGAALLGAGLAGLHAIHALALQLPAFPERHEATLVVRIADLPRAEPLRTVFPVEVEGDPASRLVGRRLRLSWYVRDDVAPPVLRAGERWRLALRLRAPRGLRNPGGTDAEMHAFADRVSAMGYVVHGERLSAADGLQGWRDATSARIGRAVERPTSRFVRALALGDTRGLTDADWTLLRADGLTHLIAISGFHVGMVASVAALMARALWWLLPGLGRRLPARIAMAAAGVAGAITYAAASGFSLPTVRTLLMIVVVALACSTRRSIAMPQALAMAAAAMLLVDPLCVLSAGFWLSFAGVAWLLWCMPRAGASPVRDLVRAQGVATVGLLPLTVVLFGQASLAGPVANLVAVPWWSLVVAPLSVAGVALDAMHPAAGAAAWRAAAWCFDLAWPLFERLADTPLSLWYLPEASGPAMPLAVLGAAWCLMPRGTPGRLLGVVLWLPLLWPDRHAPDAGEVEVTAIDVGQGLSVLVRTRTHALLYDMGPAVPDGFDAGERAVMPVLHARGVRRLDRMMVSHADLDHVGGLDAVRREMRAGELLAPDGSGVPDARPCLGGASWNWDGVRFVLLHPPLDFPYLGNEASCVLRVETRHGAFLLTGDIGADVEARLLNRHPAALRADAVFVPHHGSRHSSSEAFVRATDAMFAIVSAGHANRFRHPNGQVVSRWQAAGAQVLNTSESGAVTLRSGPDGVVAVGRREAHPRLWDAARRAAEGAGLSYRRD